MMKEEGEDGKTGSSGEEEGGGQNIKLWNFIIFFIKKMVFKLERVEEAWWGEIWIPRKTTYMQMTHKFIFSFQISHINFRYLTTWLKYFKALYTQHLQFKVIFPSPLLHLLSPLTSHSRRGSSRASYFSEWKDHLLLKSET